MSKIYLLFVAVGIIAVIFPILLPILEPIAMVLGVLWLLSQIL